MASEIRVNRLSNRSGLSTITFANGGVQFSGITTFANGEFYVGTGATIINPGTNEFNFHTGGSNRFTINNSGANLGTGNITAVDATFTGNVSIGKTLTYEDLKNVDSVGVVTARTGVKVTGGDLTVGTAITASSVTGNVTQDVGITTFSGSATWFKGLTANKDMYWSKASGSLIFKDNSAALFGNGSDLQISHIGTKSYIKDTGTGSLRICSDDFRVYNAADDEYMIRAVQDGAVELYYNGAKTVETTVNALHLIGNTAESNITCKTSDGTTRGVLGVTNSNSVTLYSGSSTKAWEYASNALTLYHTGNAKLATTSTGVTVTGNISATSNLLLADSVKARFGTGEDFQIYFDSTNTVLISNAGDIYQKSADDMYFRVAGDESGIDIIGDGAVQLYYDNSSRLRTTNNGVTLGAGGGRFVIDGNATGGTARINMTRSDFSWGIHNETNFRIYNASGNTETPNILRFEITSAGMVVIPTTTSNNSTELLRLQNTHSDGKLSVMGFRTTGLSNSQTKIYGGNDNSGVGGQGGTSGAGKFKVTITNPSGTHQEVIYAENDASSKFTRISAGGAEACRFFSSTNGKLRVGMNNFAAGPSTSNYGIEFANTNAASHWSATGTTTANHIIWLNANGTCGSIQTSGSNTSYNTSSDYRLKENVVSISDAITRVKNLSPVRFNWISDSTNTLQDGFLAHEVAPIVPEAVSGTKDAVELEDTDYVKKDDIIPQQLDASRLVPLLTAALKEAIAKIETLETKVAALEGS